MLKIVPPEGSWPSEFHDIAVSLRRVLGDLALRIDHIGSTAIAGLPAKDVIDIQVTVASLSRAVIAALTAAGYAQPKGVWRDHRPPGSTGPDSDWAKLVFMPPHGQRRTNLHVREDGRPNQRYPLLFRDYVRAHPATAQAYAELKLQLTQHVADVQAYNEVKDPAVDLIYLAAEDWAGETHWQPGPSDA